MDKQIRILEKISSLVAALPAAHVPRVLRQLHNMVVSHDNVLDNGIELNLLSAAWKGLEAALNWGPEIGKKVNLRWKAACFLYNMVTTQSNVLMSLTF